MRVLWATAAPYVNLLLALWFTAEVLWVGLRVVEEVTGHSLSPREECRARLDDWYQGRLEAQSKNMSLGLKSGFALRRTPTCTATYTRYCVPRRTQVLFSVAAHGSYARSWTELTPTDVGVLAEQFNIGPAAAAPYLRGDDQSVAVCVAQLDDDAELDVWSVSTGVRSRAGVEVRSGELLHERDDLPPAPDEIRW